MEPLTDAHKQMIDKSLLDIKGAKEIIKRSKMAGLDVADQEKDLLEIEGKLSKVRRAFFPTP